MGAREHTKKAIQKPSWWDEAVKRQKIAQTRFEAERKQAKRDQFLGGLSSLALAMDWLERHGLEVVAYENGTCKQPVILVVAGPACGLLKAQFDGHDRKTSTEGEPKRWWRAEVQGCYIDWSERMH